MADARLLERIVDRLAAGGFEPGARLPAERTLARDLGISRPALREATRALIDLRVLEPRTGSGTYLAEIALNDLIAVRLRLEPLAAALTAERASKESRERLLSIAATLPPLIDDPIAFSNADLAVHEAIAQASGNPFLATSLEGLTVAVRLSRARSAADPARRRATVDELGVLVDAIMRQDPAAAEAAMLTHLMGVRSTLEARGLPHPV